MRRIKFELTGILGNQEFEKNSDIKVKAEKLFEGLVKKVESISKCEVVNHEFIDDIVDSPVKFNDTVIEKDLTYIFVLETDVYSTLKRKEILDIIHEIATNIEVKLALPVVDAFKEYQYEIIKDSLLFDEIEFVRSICNNMENPEIKELSIELVGYDCTKYGENIEDIISDEYTGLNYDEVFSYSVDILKATERDSDMKYYELSFYHKNPTKESLDLFGEGGFTWYYKTDYGLEKNEILAQCLKECSKAIRYCDLVEAAAYLDDIEEITREEFYSSVF